MEQQDRRRQNERRTGEDRRQSDDWLYFGPERRRQVSDRRGLVAEERREARGPSA